MASTHTHEYLILESVFIFSCLLFMTMETKNSFEKMPDCFLWHLCDSNENARPVKKINKSILTCHYTIQDTWGIIWNYQRYILVPSFIFHIRIQSNIFITQEFFSKILPSSFHSSPLGLRYGVSFCVHSLIHCQTSNISLTLVGNKIVDHSDVVGASPVGAAPTTSSFST